MRKLYFIIILFALFLGINTSAQAGVINKGLKETLDYICKKVGQESTEAGAQKVSKELAEKLGEDVGHLVTKYGDDGFYALVKNPNRVQLFDSLGDDAAHAIAKHGQAAEDILTKFPDAGLAKMVSSLGVGDTRNVAMVLKNQEWYPYVSKYGQKALTFICRNPKLCLTAAGTGMIGVLWAIHDIDSLVGTIAFCVNHPFEVGMMAIVLLLLFKFRKRIIQYFKGKIRTSTSEA